MITRIRRTALGLVLAAMLSAPGCFCRRGPEPPVEKPPVLYPLCLEGSPRLNWYDGAAHTLYVRVFQLSTTDAFLQADPMKLLGAQVSLAGVEGAPVERTVFPGSKVAVEMRQHPDAAYLGVVAGYFNVVGSARVQRALPKPSDGKAKAPACFVFGPNGIETASTP